ARSIRYFGLALVVYFAGNQAESLIRKYKTKAIIALSILVLLLWWMSSLL
ncbi:MAG: DedA family protein, partial [Marinomonas sp.]